MTLFSLFSCSSTEPIPRYQRSPEISPEIKTVLRTYPPGWDDVTGRSAVPSVTLWLVNNDRAASMAVRSLTVDDSAQVLLFKEDICTIGHLSLRLRMEERQNGRRITRAPERFNGTVDYCSYMYEDNGLLRRVIVFRKKDKIFELELLQEGHEQDFQTLMSDQNIVLEIVASPQ
jgi:hypothetical protein